jgi:hypothetical protein
MATDNSGELNAFHQFIGTQLQSGAKLSPQEAVDQWRAMHPSDDDLDEIEVMVQEALDNIAAGDKGRPFEEFDLEFRRRHGLD